MTVAGWLRSLWRALAPPAVWRIPVLVALGALGGVVLVILHVGRAASYLSDRPETCMNCHVMAPQYATWQRGSHARRAVCNDCHVPHGNPLATYAFKAADGARHSFVFTFRLEPQVIQVKEAGIGVIQENCIRCHTELLSAVSAPAPGGSPDRHGGGRLCWECHRETPHGRVNSLASVPYARVPRLEPVLPWWVLRGDDARLVHDQQEENQ
ncbi:MAG: cytochrome c nitrite reductase small subunit [Bacteroidota bacterium]